MGTGYGDCKAGEVCNEREYCITGVCWLKGGVRGKCAKQGQYVPLDWPSAAIITYHSEFGVMVYGVATESEPADQVATFS
jgi:hypothetical protein